MPLVLALEPDPRQAQALKQILEQRVGAELVLADSKDSAIAALAQRIPDLILVTALLSPRDEAELTDHLRTLEGAAHICKPHARIVMWRRADKRVSACECDEMR